MKIIDTYSEIFNCFEEGKFNISLWEKYVDSIFPNMSNKLKEDSKDFIVFPLALVSEKELYAITKTLGISLIC